MYATEYPTNIPSLTDLPDYHDDIDQVTDKVVNDPKTELRACLIELGTLPKGSAADVTARLAVSLNDDGTLKNTLSPTFVNLTLSGDLAVNGGHITATSAISIKANGDNDNYLRFITLANTAMLLPFKDSLYKIGGSSAVFAEGWFDKITSNGDITIAPGGHDVLIDNADIVLLNSGYYVKFENDNNIWVGRIPSGGTTLNYYNSQLEVASNDIKAQVNSVLTGEFDNNNDAGNTRFLLYDNDNATLERVSVGAADSGGTGFKVLRIPN